MTEGDYEPIEVSKKGRHRKKQLYNSILQLMEFYFSDSNLAKDRFLSQHIYNEPYVDLSIFLKFNKIRKLNCDLEDIRKAISKSDLIELSEDREKVKRKLPIKINQNVDNCTVYIENIKADANHEWLSSIFSEFGNVVYVSIPKYKHNRTNKGFAFVEFEDEQGAENTLTYFESIGCKMPSETSPENLKSIQTFEKESDDTQEQTNNPSKQEIQKNTEGETETEEKSKRKAEDVDESNNPAKQKIQKNIEGETESEENNKRKAEDVDESNNPAKQEIQKDIEGETEPEEKNNKRKAEDIDESNKKIKVDDRNTEAKKSEDNQYMALEDSENKKKKKHKKDKKKEMIKELGLKVLSKREWKKMRNRYLDLQKKKMKEFKQYLNRQKFAPKNYDKTKRAYIDIQQKEETKEEPVPKLEFIPGVIVKIKLTEPDIDLKKLKNDIKALSSDVKYVDIPLPAGCEEIYVRFSNNKNAKELCTKDFPGEKTVLQGDEEQMYWEKIKMDRDVKFSKNVKKQRGRDKLLKKAEKERAKHIKFEEGD